MMNDVSSHVRIYDDNVYLFRELGSGCRGVVGLAVSSEDLDLEGT